MDAALRSRGGHAGGRSTRPRTRWRLLGLERLVDVLAVLGAALLEVALHLVGRDRVGRVGVDRAGRRLGAGAGQADHLGLAVLIGGALGRPGLLDRYLRPLLLAADQ